MKKSAVHLKKSFSKPTLLIDGDLYLFKAAIACENEIDWGDDIWSLSTDLKAAKKLFTSMINGFKKELVVEDVIVTISGQQNFRKDILDTYKGGRKKVRKPVGYKALVAWAMETYDSVLVDCLEADDVMGIMGSMPNTEAIIVSDDKDMKTIPCRLYRPNDNDRLVISDMEANRNFLIQSLMGDMTDGYGGCPKVGIKTAEKILGIHPTWDAVVKQYQKENLTADYALTQARMARILRCTDWDDEKGEVILWTPSR
jgi:DNA polymerase-1